MENSTPQQPNPYEFITQSTPPSAPKSPGKKRLLIILGLVLTVVAVVAAVFSLARNDMSDIAPLAGQDFTIQKFDDPLFSAELPANWVTMAGYEPGRGTVSFVSKATEFGGVDGNADILLKITVAPTAVSGALPAESIKQDRFTKDGVSYEIRSVNEDNQPEKQVLTVMHTVKEDKTLVASISTPEAYFQQQEKQLYQLLSSISLK